MQTPEDLELIPHDRLVSEVDRELLRVQLRYVMSSSSFYQEKFRAYRTAVEVALSKSELESLPLTTKADIALDQQANPPYGRLATWDNCSSLQRIHITSGSTGRPLYVVLSHKDVRAAIQAGQRAFRCAGLTVHDSVVHCLNYCLWSGGITDHQSLEATGATVIPFGVGSTHRLIETIRALRPTAISCTPSYMARLQIVLSEEFGIAPLELGLKKGLFGGEGGLQDPNFRSRIEETWGIQAIDANYGMSEILSIFASECCARVGLHYHGQGLLHLELIKPESTESLPIREGESGEMVLTNLRREAQPLVRYRTGDIITVLGVDRCACGRFSPRFRVDGRSDDMIVVRGVNVFPNAVKALLSAHPEWFTGEFEILLLQPPPVERPLIRIELSRDTELTKSGAIREALAAKCRSQLQFTPEVEFITYGAFPRTEGKTRRVRRLYD